MSLDLRTAPFAPDRLTGFGSREALIARLGTAVDPVSGPSVVAVFGLDGLDEFEKAYGVLETNAVIVRMAEEFARIIGPDGICYAPRRREFCAFFARPFASVSPILAAAAIALRREGMMVQITTAFGVAVLPEQADDATGALIVADRNLNQARRARRRIRPAVESD